jgi:hypothetical protein
VLLLLLLLLLPLLLLLQQLLLLQLLLLQLLLLQLLLLHLVMSSARLNLLLCTSPLHLLLRPSALLLVRSLAHQLPLFLLHHFRQRLASRLASGPRSDGSRSSGHSRLSSIATREVFSHHLSLSSKLLLSDL